MFMKKPIVVVSLVVVVAVVIVLGTLIFKNISQKNARLNKVSTAYGTASQQLKNPLTTLGVIDSLDAQASCQKASGKTVCSKEQGGDVVITTSKTSGLATKLVTIDVAAAVSGWARNGAAPINYLQTTATAATTYTSIINDQNCSFKLSNIANDKNLEEGPTAHILRISIGCQAEY